MSTDLENDGEIHAIVNRIENELADFYGFEPKIRAVEHLCDEKELVAAIGPGITRLPEHNARAAVFLAGDPEVGELFLGIHLSQTVCGDLLRDSPLRRLSDSNLDAFCVAVEEISHFHLIVNRAEKGRRVSKLELECQAEIDKVLVSALLLNNQVGDLHLLPLARLIYDQGTIIAKENERYWLATKYAARFWYDAVRRGDHLNGAVRRLLRESYDAPMDVKLSAA